MRTMWKKIRTACNTNLMGGAGNLNQCPHINTQQPEIFICSHIITCMLSTYPGMMMSALSFGVLLVCLTLAPGDSSRFTAYSADSKYSYSMCGCTPSTEMNVRITVIIKVILLPYSSVLCPCSAEHYTNEYGTTIRQGAANYF